MLPLGAYIKFSSEILPSSVKSKNRQKREVAKYMGKSMERQAKIWRDISKTKSKYRNNTISCFVKMQGLSIKKASQFCFYFPIFC